MAPVKSMGDVTDALSIFFTVYAYNPGWTCKTYNQIWDFSMAIMWKRQI